jgi:hypothetical protein
MGFRSFSVRFFILVIVFIGINALIWFGWVRELTNPNKEGGDLVRIGYIHGYTSLRQNGDDLPIRHIKTNHYTGQPIDMVTVGDSFSMGAGGGRNPHYQDYIASLQGMSVLSVVNLPSKTFGGIQEAAPISTLSSLINSGYLDMVKPKYLLLEFVERSALERLTKYFTLEETATIDEIERGFRKHHSTATRTRDEPFDLRFINNGNWKFIGNNLQYLFRDKANGSLVVVSKLNRSFFSSARGDRVIFYSDEIKNSRLSTPASVAQANQNLNRLAAVLKAKGITLVFMPIVDKLNLYEPYLLQHRYPRSIFFEELRKLPRDYLLIDTKEILSRSLEKGELDIFHQDDSHWTWKASQAIFSTIRISELSHAGK